MNKIKEKYLKMELTIVRASEHFICDTDGDNDYDNVDIMF